MDDVIKRIFAPGPAPGLSAPVDREKLYEEVWAEPMLTVAARYGVSSSFMARVCERLNVPRPPRGYWVQLKVGRPPKRPALPTAQPGDELEWARGREPRRALPSLPRAPEGKPRKRKRTPEERPARHELLEGVEAHYEGARENDSGYLRPSKRLLVDLFVSKSSLPRALDVANELFLTLEDRGYRVVFAPRDGPFGRPEVDERLNAGRQRNYVDGWAPARPTVVFVGTVAFGLTLFELSEEVEVRHVDGKYVRVDQLPPPKRGGRWRDRDWTSKKEMPSGRLCLRVTSPYPRAPWEKQWREAKPGELPEKFRKIIKDLKTEAPILAARVAEGARQAELERQRREVEHARWLREQEERRRIQNIEESRKDLHAVIEAWAKVKRIEEFFEDAERRAGKLGDEERRALLDRLRRARELLGETDALQRLRVWKAPEER